MEAEEIMEVEEVVPKKQGPDRSDGKRSATPKPSHNIPWYDKFMRSPLRCGSPRPLFDHVIQGGKIQTNEVARDCWQPRNDKQA